MPCLPLSAVACSEGERFPGCAFIGPPRVDSHQQRGALPREARGRMAGDEAGGRVGERERARHMAVLQHVQLAARDGPTQRTLNPEPSAGSPGAHHR